MTTRRQKVHGVEVASGSTAGAVGSVFGAAKLRDSYKESYPRRFSRGVNRVPGLMRRMGASQQAAARGARVVASGKPGFLPLATVVTAGSIATGARHYGANLDRKERRRPVSKSAFGVAERIAKTDTGSGYRPATEMTAQQHRDAGVARADVRAMTLLTGSTHRAGTGTNGVGAVYQAHAVGPGIHHAVNDSTRPSRVHPRIHYGSTVSPALERHLDNTLRPAATAGLRHPVVFHRGQTHPGAIAGAVGAHVTTGRRGHVILNRDLVSETGKTPPTMNATFKSLVHHELAHAAVKTGNPARSRTAASHLGEEARADAIGVPGRGAYRRNKVVPGRVAAHGWAKFGAHAQKRGVAGTENFGNPLRYHQVHAKVRAATPRPPGIAAETARTLARRGAQPRTLVLAGAGAAALHHHHKEQAVSKSAFGVEQDPLAKAARFAGPARLRALPAESDQDAPPRPPVQSRGWLAQADRNAAAAKRVGQQLATGVRVAKSDARMSPAPPRPWNGYLPRHTAGAVAANKSEFTASIEMPGRLRPVKPGLRVAKPLFTRVVAKSASGAGFDPEGSRHRRAGLESGLLAAGSATAGARAVRSGRTVRAHLAAAARHDVAAATHYADADSSLSEVRTRVSGHARRSAGGKAAATGLPNTAQSFRQTLGSADRVATGLSAGHGARRAQHASLAAARLAGRRSGGLAAGAVGLGAAAAAVHQHGRAGGRSYGYR